MRVNYFGPSGVGGALETVPAFDGLCLLQGFWDGVGGGGRNRSFYRM